VLVVSDYGYGIVSKRVMELIGQIANNREAPILVDSRYQFDKHWGGVTLITPNEPEAEAATGIVLREDVDVHNAAEKLRTVTGAESVCITRGKKGMYLLEKNKEGVMIPIFGTDEIADVTGAGDTVMAAFAVAISKGLPLYDAARIATVASGLVVMKSGTATVSYSELYNALKEHVGGQDR